MVDKTLRCVSCVAAMDSNRGIGKNNRLPWPALRMDLEFLDRITTTVEDEGKWNAVLLGVKTWESIDSSRQPLPGRLNIVISRTLKTPPPGAHYVCDSVLSAVKMLSSHPFTSTVQRIFVLGGTDVYKEAIESSYCDKIYLTEIDQQFEADRVFPEFDKHIYKRVSFSAEVPPGVFEEDNIQYRFCVYERQIGK